MITVYVLTRSLFSQGNIQKWFKQIGDEIQPGDALCSIETDKAVVDYEM